MAASLIESMTVDFDPDEFHDNYREALQELVNAKVEGRELVQPESPAEAAEPTSLADALKASLAAARQSPRRAGEVTAEVKEPRPEIEGGTNARRSGTARGGASGRTRVGGGKAGEGSADGSGTGRSRSSASRTRAGTAKEPASKDGQPTAAKGDAASKTRTRRRAS